MEHGHVCMCMDYAVIIIVHYSQCFFCNLSRLLRVVYGPPEESDARQAQVTTLVNNLRNTGGELEIGPCGEYQQLAVLRFSKIFTDDRYNYL